MMYDALQLNTVGDIRFEGKHIYLRRVRVSDATDEYVRWLNDPEVSQYLESRFIVQTLESVRDYIQKISDDQRNLFLAIVKKDVNQHIGNIKLGPIDVHHGRGEIGIMIGDKHSWGKGYATEAIGLLVRYAFGTLKLHKLTAGFYAQNIGSMKAFEKAGFREEGRAQKHWRFHDRYIDHVLMAMINE